MKFVKLTILILSLVIFNTEAQVISTGFGESGIYLQTSNTLINENGSVVKGYEAIEGSPYYYSEFRKSDIYFLNGKIYKDIYTRFNLYEKNLEFKEENRWYRLNSAKDIDKIVLEGVEFKLIENPTKFYDRGFYVIELKGEYKVLRQLSVLFREAKAATNSYSDAEEAQFIRVKDKFYLSLKGGELVRFKNRKEFVSMFNKENPALSDFVKTSKLNPSKVDDLKRIARFMNGDS